METNSRLPDLLSLIPEGRPKDILRFGFNDMGLSSDEIQAVLFDAHRLSRALGLLLSGGILSKGDDRDNAD